MVAGEFAVLEPKNSLAVMAIDRFVNATIENTNENSLILEDFDLGPISWNFRQGHVHIDTQDDRIRFVRDAMTIVLTYLDQCSIDFSPFSLRVKSELDDESGKKYGLGSSAAVVTAVISAILTKFLPEKPSSNLIFKLAAISHVVTQGNGSGADVAASSYGGILKYTSFQADWLKEAYKNNPFLPQFVAEDWPFLSLEPIELPKEVHVCVGWTGKPASTVKLVDKVLQLKASNNAQFQHFLSESGIAVENFLKGMKNNDIQLLLNGVKRNRQALAEVGKNANAPIETPMLKKLSDLAEQYGGAGKPSGAGGGDCGLAFMPSFEKAEQLKQAWQEAGIMPLDITVSPSGAATIK